MSLLGKRSRESSLGELGLPPRQIFRSLAANTTSDLRRRLDASDPVRRRLSFSPVRPAAPRRDMPLPRAEAPALPSHADEDEEEDGAQSELTSPTSVSSETSSTCSALDALSREDLLEVAKTSKKMLKKSFLLRDVRTSGSDWHNEFGPLMGASVVEVFPRKCRFAPAGCTSTQFLASLIYHEEVCRYRFEQVACPSRDCRWKGLRSLFPAHSATHNPLFRTSAINSVSDFTVNGAVRTARVSFSVAAPNVLEPAVPVQRAAVCFFRAFGWIFIATTDFVLETFCFNLEPFHPDVPNASIHSTRLPNFSIQLQVTNANGAKLQLDTQNATVSDQPLQTAAARGLVQTCPVFVQSPKSRTGLFIHATALISVIPSPRLRPSLFGPHAIAPHAVPPPPLPQVKCENTDSTK